jgi:CO/xanthine dehydrogenase Mo-binding subunit
MTVFARRKLLRVIKSAQNHVDFISRTFAAIGEGRAACLAIKPFGAGRALIGGRSLGKLKLVARKIYESCKRRASRPPTILTVTIGDQQRGAVRDKPHAAAHASAAVCLAAHCHRLFSGNFVKRNRRRG